MNEKMRGINIQEKASMCGKCKMWLVMVVFALISTAMLSSVKIHAASAEENQMADIETNHVTAVENTQEQITVNIPVKLKITGNSQQNEIFSFLLKQNDEQSPMPMISKVHSSREEELSASAASVSGFSGVLSVSSSAPPCGSSIISMVIATGDSASAPAGFSVVSCTPTV